MRSHAVPKLNFLQSKSVLFHLVIISYWHTYAFELVKIHLWQSPGNMWGFFKQMKSCNYVQPETKQGQSMFNQVFVGQLFNKCKNYIMFVMGLLCKVVFFLSRSLKCNKGQSRTLDCETFIFPSYVIFGKKTIALQRLIWTLRFINIKNRKVFC